MPYNARCVEYCSVPGTAGSHGYRCPYWQGKIHRHAGAYADESEMAARQPSQPAAQYGAPLVRSVAHPVPRQTDTACRDTGGVTVVAPAVLGLVRDGQRAAPF